MSLKTVTETSWCVLTAPGVRYDGENYIECEAVLCYDNTERNPNIYWAPVSYDQAYTCCSFGIDRVKRWVESPDLRKTLKTSGGLTWVDVDGCIIKEVNRTVTIEDDVKVVGLS